jgi:thioredoxin-related protein
MTQQNKLRIIRVNVHDTVGKILVEEYRVTNIPTFIFFDNQSNEIWRSLGHLNYDQVVSSADAYNLD